MKKKGQSFGSFFLSAARESGATLPVRLLYAVILAGICCFAVLALPVLVPSLASRFSGSLFDSASGAVYVYTVLATLIIIVGGMIASKLFVFDEVISGKWGLASSCGADLSRPCLAKALFAFWAPLSTYIVGAVIFCAAVRLIGGDGFSEIGQQEKLLAVGALTMILVFSLEIIFAAAGAQKNALPFICLPFLILALVLFVGKSRVPAANGKPMRFVWYLRAN